MRFNIDLGPRIEAINHMFQRLNGDVIGDVVETGLVRGARQAAREVRKTTKWKDRRPGIGLRSKIRGGRGKPKYTPSAIVHVGGKGARQGNILQYGSVNSTKAKGFVDERMLAGQNAISREFDAGMIRHFRRVLEQLSGEATLRARTIRALNRSAFVFGRFRN